MISHILIISGVTEASASVRTNENTRDDEMKYTLSFISAVSSQLFSVATVVTTPINYDGRGASLFREMEG